MSPGVERAPGDPQYASCFVPAKDMRQSYDSSEYQPSIMNNSSEYQPSRSNISSEYQPSRMDTSLKSSEYQPSRTNVSSEYQPSRTNISSEYHPSRTNISSEYQPSRMSNTSEYQPSGINHIPEDTPSRTDNSSEDTPPNYQQGARRRLSSSTVSPSDTSSSSVDSELSREEKLQIESSFRGLKTQMFVCKSLANLYLGKVSSRTQENNNINWELHYTGIPLIILDTGETRSRNKRKISILLAERGTCFALWQDRIDNLSSYKISGEGFHTMYLSSDHTTMIGLSFDNIESSKELWMYIEKLTSCPENICLSMPKSKLKSTSSLVNCNNQKIKFKLPDKSLISTPCCFQHITNVDVSDKERYYSLQTLLPGQHVVSNHSSNNSHL